MHHQVKGELTLLHELLSSDTSIWSEEMFKESHAHDVDMSSLRAPLQNDL